MVVSSVKELSAGKNTLEDAFKIAVKNNQVEVVQQFASNWGSKIKASQISKIAWEAALLEVIKNDQIEMFKVILDRLEKGTLLSANGLKHTYIRAWCEAQKHPACAKIFDDCIRKEDAERKKHTF